MVQRSVVFEVEMQGQVHMIIDISTGIFVLDVVLISNKGDIKCTIKTLLFSDCGHAMLYLAYKSWIICCRHKKP